MKLKILSATAVSIFLLVVVACNNAGANSNSIKASTTVNAANAADTNVKDDRAAKLGSLELKLIDQDGQCLLIHNDVVIKLDMPAGCDFNRNQDGSLRVYPDAFYPDKKDAGQEKIFLVEHSEKLKDNKDCDTKLRAVKVISKDSATEFELSAKMENLAMCAPNSWDEVNFVGAFPMRK